IGGLLAALLLVCSCSTVPAPGVASVRAAMERFITALNALDAERISACFTDDVTVFVPTAQAGRVSGKAAVDRIFRDYVEATRKTASRTNIVPEDLQVEVADGLALVTFTVRGKSSTARRSFVFRRVGDVWLISHFHASNLRAQ
ncbi:MAG: YybH family protein, partial [Burkholderiales bacterium]